MKKIVMIIMAVVLIALPTMAQDWQSTSTMQGSGSVYTPQVNAVGAANVSSLATTTESYSPSSAPSGPNRGKKFDTGAESGQSEEFPIGDAVLPLLLLAGAYLIMRATRRRALKR